MSSHDDMQEAARLIVEDTMSRLAKLGADHQAAAKLLAIQGYIRIENKQAQAELISTLTSLMDG
ncbi:hypothetical protein [Nitratireductor aquibiodomus]|uniref:hypothetical protein n=1 Tax=Nitratireductor aquibiodomus TaxID=204799 RepID=UPI000469738F|nr:hypothetical protein [Nitratireductor aquibiodomus]